MAQSGCTKANIKSVQGPRKGTRQGKSAGEHLDARQVVPVQLVELGRRGGRCRGRLVWVVAPQQAIASLPLALSPACHVTADSTNLSRWNQCGFVTVVRVPVGAATSW